MKCPCGREVVPVVGQGCPRCFRIILGIEVVDGKVKVTWSDVGGVRHA